MNTIYVGSSKPETINDYLAKLGSAVSYAGNTLQNALLEGLSALCPKFQVISSWSVTPYPKVKKLFFHRQVSSIGSGHHNYISTSILNLPGLNMLYRFIRVRSEIKSAIVMNDDNAVVIYEVHSPFLLAAATLRRRVKHICVIVPDLPEHMIAHGNPLRTIAKKIDHKLIDWCLSRFDSYVLLSDQMQERLPMCNKKWVLMEGIFREKLADERPEKDPHKVVMYTGILHKDKGIANLINAFEMIDSPDYRLWIRGYGDYADEIVKKSQTDSRIVYLEPMEHADLVKMEQRATVMVNPTQPFLEFTKYFFPSKTMEYLACGTPTVMYKLPCMPREYDEYIYYVDGDSTEALYKKLVEICEKPEEELECFGKAASEFILTKKTPVIQCAKIVNLING